MFDAEGVDAIRETAHMKVRRRRVAKWFVFFTE